MDNIAHPIDLAEYIAHDQEWAFCRHGEDGLSMEIGGLWSYYRADLDWLAYEKILQLSCCFELARDRGVAPEFYRLLNLTNLHCPVGCFAYDGGKSSVAYRYVLLSESPYMEQGRIERMVKEGVEVTERFFPAFQLVSEAGAKAEEALQMSVAEIYGHA